MRATRMYAGEVQTDATVVRQLLAGQFPQWAGLPIELVVSYGTAPETPSDWSGG